LALRPRPDRCRLRAGSRLSELPQADACLPKLPPLRPRAGKRLSRANRRTCHGQGQGEFLRVFRIRTKSRRRPAGADPARPGRRGPGPVQV